MRERSLLAQKSHPQLSLRKQCELLAVNRGRLYYKPRGESALNLQLMEMMDKHLNHYPTEGVKSLVHYLGDFGYRVNHKRIRRLLRLMGRETVYRRKNLTKKGDAKYVKPYLLRNMEFTHANQAWCTDITYIPMKKGFMYLTAVMDIYSRKILSWSVSNTMEKEWCIQVLDQAIRRHGKPEIINSDQGSQYTSEKYNSFLHEREIKISMDGKGRATDNTWIERFWRTIKENHVYINPANDGLSLYEGIDRYMKYYNRKTHQTIKEKPNRRFEASRSKQAA